MSYQEFYGLKREPFSNAPVGQFYFNSVPHSQALTRLTHAVQSMKGLAVLTGDLGTGKTTLARRLLESLPENQYEAALLVIIHSGVTASWLVRRIAVQLGVAKPSDEKLALLGQVYQRLLQIHESGRKAVVLVDEAQMLQSREIMEEFRGLLNLELPEEKLLTFVLFGLPDLEDYLRLDPPLAHRIAFRVRLQTLTRDATEAYIKHRLRLAGASRMPFSAEAVGAIHRFTDGTPRLINTVCDNCLFEGFLAKAQVVSEKLVTRVSEDLGLEAHAPSQTLSVSVPPPAAPRPPAPPPGHSAAARPARAPARPAPAGAPGAASMPPPVRPTAAGVPRPPGAPHTVAPGGRTMPPGAPHTVAPGGRTMPPGAPHTVAPGGRTMPPGASHTVAPGGRTIPPGAPRVLGPDARTMPPGARPTVPPPARPAPAGGVRGPITTVSRPASPGVRPLVAAAQRPPAPGAPRLAAAPPPRTPSNGAATGVPVRPTPAPRPVPVAPPGELPPPPGADPLDMAVLDQFLSGITKV